jgi:TIR domain
MSWGIRTPRPLCLRRRGDVRRLALGPGSRFASAHISDFVDRAFSASRVLRGKSRSPARPSSFSRSGWRRASFWPAIIKLTDARNGRLHSRQIPAYSNIWVDGAIGRSLEATLEKEARSIFVSYRSVDDEPPPGSQKDRGFVSHLLKQLRWELSQLGVLDALWRDRAKIAPGDVWNDAIRNALSNADLFLAVLSWNYIQSDWCAKELSTMTSRIKMMDALAGLRRIFRVDKHSVPDEQIPEALRAIQSVRFYAKDDETTRDYEYFWRGKIRRKEEYLQAVNQLANAICERLRELGIPVPPQVAPPKDETCASTGRVIFLAKPAVDVVDEYLTLARELRRNGYRVKPDADKDLPRDGEKARAAVLDALTEAEASIHLLGERSGGRPDGLDVDLVPLQLASAALEVQKRAEFQRLIWAPKVPPGQLPDDVRLQRRDPFNVLDRFDRRLATDQIDGDTASRFNEFVLQRLSNEAQRATPEAIAVYVRCAPDERNVGMSVARELKQLDFASV